MPKKIKRTASNFKSPPTPVSHTICTCIFFFRLTTGDSSSYGICGLILNIDQDSLLNTGLKANLIPRSWLKCMSFKNDFLANLYLLFSLVSLSLQAKLKNQQFHKLTASEVYSFLNIYMY